MDDGKQIRSGRVVSGLVNAGNGDITPIDRSHVPVYKCCMLLLLLDAEVKPGLFCPFGPIPRSELREWLYETALALPSDLIELWEVAGGGDMFESETIFRPTVSSTPYVNFVDDHIEDRNAVHTLNGKPSGLYIFHEGAFLSAVQLSDRTYVTLKEDYCVDSSFRSLDEWYVRTLRAEFGERYGLQPLRL